MDHISHSLESLSSMEATKDMVIPHTDASPNKGEWLLSITGDCEHRLKADRSRTKPRIQRVPDLLRKNNHSSQLFEPDIVSIGPYHAAKPHLQPMEPHKIAAAKQFVAGTGHSIETFYNKVREVASRAKDCYATLPPGLTEEEFADMMFFDGCFLLHFIDLFVRNNIKDLTMAPHHQGFVMKDIFLLENQLPFLVLDALMTLKHVDLASFIHRTVIGQGIPSAVEEQGVHLLDLLRQGILGTPAPEEELSCPSGPHWETFRSVAELKEVGINFRKSKTKQLRDITFTPGFVHGWLSLPQILVDDLTRSRFLNLIALEMCPDSRLEYGITSYVWFMDRLIDIPGDVKELRWRGILLNALGSDEQVAELFNELAKDLMPDRQAYRSVTMRIARHCQNEMRVSVVRMLHTHFDTPWAVIGFCAAVFLLVLTVVQTYFAIWPLGESKK